MTNRLRVAVIGVGYFSQFHFDAWKRLDVELAGICDWHINRARDTANQYGIGSAFDDLETMLLQTRPDLLDIIIPPSGHLEVIKTAARAGINMICQKPFTANLDEAEAAVTVARDAGVLLVVHENFRFQPWYMEIKRQLSAKVIGEPYQITFRLRPGDGQGSNAYLDRQPYFRGQKRFLINETAVHLVDVFRYLFGEVRSVWADLQQLNPVIAGEDAGIVVFSFDGQRRAVFDGNRLADHVAENRRLTMGEMLVEGSDGVMRLDGNGRLYLRQFRSNQENEITYCWENRAYAGDCVFRLQHHVVEHFISNAPIQNPAEDYLCNLKIVENIYRSNDDGQKLQIET